MTDRDADAGDADEETRQRIVRVPGSRRARLTPAPGTDPSPEAPAAGPTRQESRDAKGPNDDQLLRDVPPHY